MSLIITDSFKVGDSAMYNGTNDYHVRVEIMNIFECDGITYVEIKPLEFNSISREVPISMLSTLS